MPHWWIYWGRSPACMVGNRTQTIQGSVWQGLDTTYCGCCYWGAMMLGLAIARLRGWLTRKGKTTVSPTLTAGPVCPEHTQPRGKPCSAGTTCHQCKPASHPASTSSDSARPTSVATSCGSETQPVQQGKKSKAAGTKQAIPAHQTRQPASSAAKPKQKAAKRGTSGKKTTRAKASVPTRTASRSGHNGT